MELFDAEGAGNVQLSVVEGSPEVAVTGDRRRGCPYASLRATSLDISDENGMDRLSVGSVAVSDGEELRYTDISSITLQDEHGEVIWQAPNRDLKPD